MIGEAFRRRYLLTRFPSSGVVVDLTTGNYFQVNASAAAICAALASSEGKPEAVDRVRRELALDQAKADAAIDSLVRELSVATTRGTPQGSYLFAPVDGGYSLSHGDKPVMLVDGEELTLRLPAGRRDYSDRLLALYVRALSPKLLFLRGIDVLHSSSVEIGGRLTAFSGESGAGKTTTAHAFATAGARLVSEELLVFHPDRGNGLRIVQDGEAITHAWVDRAVAAMQADPARVVRSDDLANAGIGNALPLSTILFLDVRRRTGSSLTTRPLAGAEAMAAVMYNGIVGSASPTAWTRFCRFAVGLMASIEVLEATTPEAIALLETAARAYISRRTS